MRALILAAALALAACAAPSGAPSKPADAPPGIPAAQINAPAAPIIDTSGPTSTVKLDRIACSGHAVQGGFVICKTAPGAIWRMHFHGGVPVLLMTVLPKTST